MVIDGPKGYVVGIVGCLGLVTGFYYLSQCMSRPDEDSKGHAAIQQQESQQQFQRRSANLRKELYDAGVHDTYNH